MEVSPRFVKALPGTGEKFRTFMAGSFIVMTDNAFTGMQSAPGPYPFCVRLEDVPVGQANSDKKGKATGQRERGIFFRRRWKHAGEFPPHRSDVTGSE